jgi:uncharacterized protein
VSVECDTKATFGHPGREGKGVMRMGNAVVHFDLAGPDPEGTSRFYAELFGWRTQVVPGGYILIDTHAGGGINGGIMGSRDEPPWVAFYAEVPDVQATLDKTESMGSKTIVPLTVIPDMVTFALFTDPQGNPVGLVQGDGTGEGGPSAGDNPDVSWFELQCADPARAWDFYRELFGWEFKTSEGGGSVYGEVDTGTGRGISGGIGGSQDGQPHVNVYARVDDLAKYLERAESLGGKAIVQPMDVGEGTSIAMFTDPQGTWFGLYTR